MEASPVMSPLFLMLQEAGLILQRSESLGKLEREKFLQKLLDETDATLHEVLHYWISAVVKYKEIRSSVAAAVATRSSTSHHQDGHSHS